MRVLGLTALTVPVVLGADAATSGVAPDARIVLLVGGVVALAVALAGPLLGRLRTRPAVLLAATAVGGQLAGHLTLLALRSGGSTEGCLPAVGRGADAGLRLALLRSDPACPPGTLGLTPMAAAALGLVGVALLVLAGHALAAVVAGVALAFTEASLGAVRSLLALIPRPPLAVILPSTPARPVQPARRETTWTPRLFVPGVLGLRGPPVPAA